MTTSSLCVLRSLLNRGWEATLLPCLLSRCGSSPAEWEELLTAGYVAEEKGRVVLTPAGKKMYRREKVGRHF